MNKFRLISIDMTNGEETWENQEWYDTLEEAQDAKCEIISNLQAGYDTMRLMSNLEDDEKFDPNDLDFRIEEVDENGEVLDTYEY